MGSIRAYVIHHNDPARCRQRLAIAELLAELQIPVQEINEQPPLLPLPSGWRGRWLLLGRVQARTAADFQQRRRRWPRRALALRCRQLWVQGKAVLELMRAPWPRLEPLWRHLQVEALVSAKHIRAWRQARQEGADLALVFEDDVECEADSRMRLETLMRALPQQEQFYVDLAGGLALAEVLPLDQVQERGGPAELWLRGVHTNTACGYLVSAPLLRQWLQALVRQPALALLPIDHLINRASAQPAVQACSGHWQEPPFRHGSFCGTARSWQQ